MPDADHEPPPEDRPRPLTDPVLADMQQELLPEALRAYAHLVLHRVRDLVASTRATGRLDAGRAEAIAADIATLNDRAARAMRRASTDALPAIVQAREHVADALRLVVDLVEELTPDP
ncbi:MAG: hypothetical protein F2817_18575 [Actinobacteria bacterium]|nr:hypothetical protein [Actinomycetota bacterium]